MLKFFVTFVVCLLSSGILYAATYINMPADTCSFSSISTSSIQNTKETCPNSVADRFCYTSCSYEVINPGFAETRSVAGAGCSNCPSGCTDNKNLKPTNELVCDVTITVSFQETVEWGLSFEGSVEGELWVKLKALLQSSFSNASSINSTTTISGHIKVSPCQKAGSKAQLEITRGKQVRATGTTQPRIVYTNCLSGGGPLILSGQTENFSRDISITTSNGSWNFMVIDVKECGD